MKKLVTISLIILFLLYQIGFIAVYWVTKSQIDSHWNSTVYYDQPLKKVSVPLSMPYWTDQGDYRPVNGTIELDGVPYRKVFQKYEKDTIHVLVVRDTMTEKLENVTRELITSQAEAPINSKSHSSYLFLKNDLQIGENFDWDLNKPDIFLTHNTGYIFHISTQYIAVETPPPQNS